MRKALLTLIILAGIMVLDYGCGRESDTQAESAPPASDISEQLIYKSYKVADVREAYSGIGDASNYRKSITIVVEDNNKTRYFIEYNVSVGFGSRSDESEVNTYNNLKVIIPGDYISYCASNHDFEFITEEEFYSATEEK